MRNILIEKDKELGNEHPQCLQVTEEEFSLICDLVYRESYICKENGEIVNPVSKLYAKLRK